MAPVTNTDLEGLKLGYASQCLGMHSNHTLELKFKAMADHGFKYVELGFGNYVNWVRSQVPDLPPSTCPKEWMADGEPDPSDDQIWDAFYDQAGKLRDLAGSNGLELLMLQPLNQYDGWEKGTKRDEWVRRKAQRWLKLCEKLGVQYLQVGANDDPGATVSDDKVADDMRYLAELGAQNNPKTNIAYEQWCFSPRKFSNWEETWKIVEKVNHPNLGMCLDSAQMAICPAYGFDPLTGKGCTDEDYQGLLKRLRALPADKIFYFEVSDVLAPKPPLTHGSEFDEWHAKNGAEGKERMTWVMNARAVPYIGRKYGTGVRGLDDMGKARVNEVFEAILSTGFRGPVIWECFEALEMEKDDAEIPDIYARVGKLSKEKLWADVSGR